MISFMYLHFLTFKRKTHVTHKLQENHLDEIQESLFYNIKLIKKLRIVFNVKHGSDSNIFENAHISQCANNWLTKEN